MKINIRVFFLILCLAISQLGYSQTILPNTGIEHVDRGKIRIKLKKENFVNTGTLKSVSTTLSVTELGIESVDGLNKTSGITRIERVFPFSLKNEAKHRKYGLHLWFELSYDSSDDPFSIAEKYSLLSEVEIAKPVYKKIRLDGDLTPTTVNIDKLIAKSTKSVIKTASAKVDNAGMVVFNDPLLPKQWHYDNNGDVGDVDIDIDLPQAWSKNSGSADVIVAVVDGGIDTDHEDLRANLWVNKAELDGEDGVDDDQNGYVDDIYGSNFVLGGDITAVAHGTHVAGTVGAVSNNGIGVAGVAGGDGSGNGVRLMSCQVFDERQTDGGNFAAAIIYGADNGAVISQNSWGYTQPGYYEPEVLDAIRYFIAEAGQYEGSLMKGGVLFFAAGNNGAYEEHYPGAFEEVIAVSATGPDGSAAPYSNYGEWTDIAAPGGDQFNYEEEGGILSTLPDNEYGYYQGTSMACPHVSGIAALVVSKMGNSDFTASELQSIILGSVTSFNFDDQGFYGIGNVNASNALDDNDNIKPDAINDLNSFEVYHDGVVLQWTVPVDADNYQPTNFYLAFSDEEITGVNFDRQTVFQIPNNYEAGTLVSIRLGGLIKNKEYWFAVKSADRFENISGISNILKITTTNEPHFMVSESSVSINIDASVNELGQVPITLSNTGDGVIDWSNYVVNEKIYFEEQEELALRIKEKADSYVETAGLSSVNQEIAPLVTTAALQSTTPDYWYEDNTVFKTGMSYEKEGAESFLLRSTNEQAGLVFATRFNVEIDYTINLTHIEAALYLENNDKPILVELRKGSKRVEEAETVYIQEYFVDTTNVFGYQRIPIYRPQRFEDGEVFWVVLHFPKEEEYPLGIQIHTYHYGHFLLSKNNGRGFVDAQSSQSKPVVPMIRALSTGDDGSYVFLDPAKGSIASDESQNANIVIDANSLTNGKHLASLNIQSNDIHKPIVCIEVLVNVSGKNPELDNTKTYDFNIYKDKTNNLEFELKNIGLGNLEISDIVSVDPGLVKDFETTITIKPGETVSVPFTYTTSTLGSTQFSVTLNTNIGDITLITKTSCIETAQLQMSLDNDELSLAQGETAELELTLTNTSVNTVLDYDLEHYDVFNVNKNILSEKLEYQISTSNEPGGPEANQWDDISAIGTNYDNAAVWEDNIELGMQFPLFNETYSVAKHQYGYLYFSASGYYNQYFNGLAGVVAPLDLKDINTGISKLTVYSYGDRSVFTFKMQFNPYDRDVEPKYYTYQVVVFRDGSIEFRYKDVDTITEEMDYYIALLGLDDNDFIPYRELGESDKNVSNGLVIRYKPVNSFSFITNATPKKGLIEPGASVKVKLDVDPQIFEITEGIYENNVVVKSNTINGTDTTSLKLNISGIPSIEIGDTLEFEPTNIGHDNTHYLKISNIGSGLAVINNVNIANAAFTIQDILPITIEGKANYQLPVTFTPSVAGEVNSSMTIVFDNSNSREITLTAAAKEDPNYVLNIQPEISVDIQAGNTLTVPFSITNMDKGVDLQYQFANSCFGSVSETALQSSLIVADEAIAPSYVWNVSNEEKIIHKWDDIVDGYEELFIEENKQEGIKLPFDFPFYGNTYDSLWVSKNGYVTVEKPETDGNLGGFEKGDGLKGMIAPFWTTLLPPDPSVGIKYKAEDDRIYLQWDEYSGYNPGSTGGPITFQLEIVSDGSIYFHYHNVEKWMGTLIYGLESPEEEQILYKEGSVIIMWSDVADNVTIAITPSSQGSIVSGEVKEFDLKISADRIYKSGVYQDTVLLKTNSLSHPFEIIPFTLNVSGDPVLETIKNQIWNDVIYSDNTILTRKIKIYNKGYDNLILDKIEFENLDGLTLYDNSGEKLTQNSAGTLLKPIEIAPWKYAEIEVVIPVEQKQDIQGNLSLNGNFETFDISISANLIDSPVFLWDASNQDYSLNSSDEQTYSFTVRNEGTTNLSYKMKVATVPSDDSGYVPGIIDEKGHYQVDNLPVLDSLALETKEVGDGVYFSQIGGTVLFFCNQFVAPENGFYLTHIKSYMNIVKTDEPLRLMVYKGGDNPQSGELIYQQDYVVDKSADKQWVYFPMESAVQINSGEQFFVTLVMPEDFTSATYVGYDLCSDKDILKKSWVTSYWGGRPDSLNWRDHSMEYTLDVSWKIRAITSSENGNWIELDQEYGDLGAGEETLVTATIFAKKAANGTQKGKVFVSTNDVNHGSDKFDISLNVNGAPELKFRPNQYTDTLKVVETEKLVLNYLVEDPEGDAITFSKPVGFDEFNMKLSQTSEKAAQIEFISNYESAGVYNCPIEIKDAVGNITRDTILLEITDKNRAPVLNPDFGTITLNLADPMDAYTIDPEELFTDPDGDDLQIVAGNYTPEIVDLALGYNYIDIHPLLEGTGFLVFGADDGKENGYVLYGVYVQIINDPNALGADTDALDDRDDTFVNPPQSLLIYPNFVTNETSTVQIKLQKDADAQIEVYDLMGRTLNIIKKPNLNSGMHQFQINFAQYGTGTYICRFNVNGEFIQTQKVLVK